MLSPSPTLISDKDFLLMNKLDLQRDLAYYYVCACVPYIIAVSAQI